MKGYNTGRFMYTRFRQNETPHNKKQGGRTLSHRLKEQRRVLTSINLIHFALVEHAAAHDHAIDWGSAKVFDTYHQF